MELTHTIETLDFRNIERKNSSNKKSRVRSSMRVNELLLITFYRAMRCFMGSFAGNWSPHDSAGQAKKWAQSFAARGGVDIVRIGETPPKGVLLVANHRSYIDALAILKDVPCFFLAKAEVADWPLLGHAARIANTIFVKRDNFTSRKACLNAIAERIEEGASVMVFPEGTTFEGPGILPFHKGIFKLAARRGIPIVPVAIEYEDSNDAWVGNESFVNHFIKTFSKKRIEAYVHYGPFMKSEDGEKLERDAWNWISGNVRQLT